ncbi:MAG: DUF1822 family protein [Microcystaceae cyanobacterium]
MSIPSITLKVNPMTLSSFSVPLTRLAHQAAQQFYQGQKHPQKAKETYLNCLAVYAVDYYLSCLSIPTSKSKDIKQLPIYQTLANLAELEVLNQGKLECRPVLPNHKTCYIPAETWQDRIGYVAVQFNQSLTEAQIIGFLESVNSEKVDLSAFQSLDKLWEKLAPSPLTCLGQWLQEIITQEWQELSELVNPKISPVAVRYSPESDATKWIEKGKLIQLPSLSKPLVLGVAVKLTEDLPMTVSIDVYPDKTQDHLPKGVKMQILDESETPIMQAISQESNPYLRFLFKASEGDQVFAEVTYQSDSCQEKFII